MTRNHEIAPVSKLQKKVLTKQAATCRVLCDCSQNSEVSVYCQDHDDVICQSCTIVKHRACKTVSIGKKCASYPKEKFAAVAQKADKLNNETDQILKERNTDLTSYTSMKEKAKGDMQTFRQKINRQIDMMEQTMLKDLDDRESMNRQEVGRHVSSCTTTKQLIQTDLKILSDAKKSADKADMFAADVKVSKRLTEYERLLSDIHQEAKSPNLTFKKNEQLWDMLIKIKNIGTLVEDNSKSDQRKKMVLTHLKVGSLSKKFIKMSSDRFAAISGCAFMPDGQVVLCDYHKYQLILLDKSFTLQGSLDLPSRPWDISAVDDTTAIITLPDKQQLQYIEVAPRLKQGRVLQFGKCCRGVQVVGSDIYVTCHKSYPGGDGEVRILDKIGNLRKRLGVNQDGTFMFSVPLYLTVTARSDKIYVSDCDQHTVTCLSSGGTVIFQYKYSELREPRGVCVDDEDNVIVCGEGSHNVHVVTAAGKKHSVILTSKDCIMSPYSVAFRQTDNTMIIGCYDNLFLVNFVAKWKPRYSLKIPYIY